MFMKRNIVIGVIIAIVVVLTVINQKPQASSTIKIGVVGPFTGNSAVFGDFMQRGIDFALAGLSEEERARVQIIKEDDQCAGKNAISAVQKLIDFDKVNYVIGPLCNESSIATEKIFDDNKIISLTIGLPSNTIANMGPYHFSFSPEIEFLMKKINAEISRQKLGRIAIVHMNGPFEKENYIHFVKYYIQNGGLIVADESVVKGTIDFNSVIAKIKQANPDSLMIIAHTAELNNILKQLQVHGLGNLPKFGIHAAETPMLAKNIELAEGLIYGYPADKNEIESARIYAEMYRDKFNAEPDSSSVNTFDSLNILLEAIDKCGYDDKDCVRDYFAHLTDYQGANGSLSVDERGVGTYKEIMLKIVKDGRFQKLNI